MSCAKMCSGCPFDVGSEETEMIQNWGCLPTPYDIMKMRVEHDKTWACHSDVTKPCAGAIMTLKKLGLPYKVVDQTLVDERVDWSQYCQENVS